MNEQRLIALGSSAGLAVANGILSGLATHNNDALPAVGHLLTAIALINIFVVLLNKEP